MAQAELNITLRETSGKGVARKLRANGQVPAVVYGKGMEPCAISFEPKALEVAVSSKSGKSAKQGRASNAAKRAVCFTRKTSAGTRSSCAFTGLPPLAKSATRRTFHVSRLVIYQHLPEILTRRAVTDSFSLLR
jgi:hypothetical protein